MAAGLVVLLAACGGGDPTGGTPGDGSAPSPVSCGADLSSLKQTVYVSTGGTDAAGCGQTTASACKSIAHGIATCTSAGCGVLVRHGLYPTTATITLRDGVSVYGSCRFDGEPDRLYRTTIDASPAPGTPALSATSVNTPTVVRGLVVIGKDETAASTASLGVVISRSPGLTLTHNVIAGGRGGDGSAAVPAGAAGGNGSPGAAGALGGAGGPSCPARAEPNVGRGGHGGTDETKATYVSSFNWQCVSTDLGERGQPSGGGALGGMLGTKGAHGIACGGRPHDYPGNGTPGVDGPAGACGAAAQASPLSAGSFQGTTWLASRGDDGRVGAIGAGGGGGGAGGACVSETEGFIYTGLTGGGGGGGGCGGPSGPAGQQGGASIPLVLSDAALTFDAALNGVVPGPGGRGGRGGDGVAGGTGGTGGPARSGPQYLYLGHYCPGLSAQGGRGGDGGAGSAGAGGHGGPSIGIAVLGTTVAPAGADAIYAPLPGLPSRGGRSGGSVSPGGACSRTIAADGANGVIGLGATTFSFAGPPQNFLAGGQRLAIGESRSSLNGLYRLHLQTDRNLCLGRGNDVLWCSINSGFGQGDELRMQTDGNLCLYTGGQNPACTDSSTHPGAYLLIQDDGRVVLFDGSTVLWAKP